jgi:hypothetical protein
MFSPVEEFIKADYLERQNGKPAVEDNIIFKRVYVGTGMLANGWYSHGGRPLF